MTEAIKGAVKSMIKMNKQLKLPELQVHASKHALLPGVQVIYVTALGTLPRKSCPRLRWSLCAWMTPWK
jgi:hypothetical protein